MARNKLVLIPMQAPGRHKILLLDDDQELLELYREILGRLRSQPEIHTATSGARALALLDSDNFSLLLCDLKMPKMDGLQVLTIVRRKFPQLRTAVLTCILDEQFRTRAYAMGIDLFLEKPNSSKEINFLLDCVESLLDRGEGGGFRGVQSKSLVDIIQLECLSQSSSVLKISNGVLEGRIWIQSGEIVDASTDGLAGLEAFHAILSWKTGNFELLPEEPGRTRTIFTSYQGLLLETAQAQDEARSNVPAAAGSAPAPASPLAELTRHAGVEFALTVATNDAAQFKTWGLDNPDQIASWTHATMDAFHRLGEVLQLGMFHGLEGHGPIQNVTTARKGDRDLCLGFHRSLPFTLVQQTTQKILAQWPS